MPAPEKSQNVQKFESVACDACGSLRHKILYQYEFSGEGTNIVECKDCNFTYLSPRPRSAYLLDFYGNDYYSFSINKADDFNPNNPKHKLRRTVMKHHFKYRNIDVSDTLRVPPVVSGLFKAFVAVPHYQENGRLLDVGCGAGQKLLEFKSLGWDVRGLELSQAAAAEGQKMGLEILTTTLSEVPWPAEYFSAVTFYHSLEHFPSPHLMLREVFRLLNPGGEILVVVPNFGCLERKLFGRDWGWMQVPVHFCHFTKATLTRIISEAGFKVAAVGFSPAGQSAELSFFNHFPLARRLSKRALSLFGVACAMAGTGKALIVSARK